ncbi:YwbE family protein [Lachnospiraceae bacterium 48-21]
MENHMYRGNIGPGSRVKIILKKDQKSGKLTEGYVDRILTNRPVHTRGIKVMLKDGQVGRGSMDLNVIYIMVGSKIKTGDMLYQSDNKKESWEIFQRDYRLGEVELDQLKYGFVDIYEEYSVSSREFSEEFFESEIVQKTLME